MLRNKLTLLICAVALSCSLSGTRVGAQQSPATQQSPGAQQQQESEDTVRVRHRVVFLDALVRDKRTSNLINDLKTENFEVLADGKPRQISYFNREGDAGRKPLALVIVLDLRRDGAGRYLRRTEILEAMAAEIARMPPQDEVGLMVLKAGGSDDKREWLSPLTRNRAQIAAALSVVPSLIAEGSPGSADDADNHHSGLTISKTIGDDAEDEKEQKAKAKAKAGDASNVEPQAAAKERDAKDRAQQATESPGVSVNETGIESQTTMTGKNGDTVTRTVYKNGEVRTKRVSKDGKTEIDIGAELDMAASVHEVSNLVVKERPNSQAAMVWVSDGIAPVFYVEREVALAQLTKSNIIFSALVTDMKFGFKLFKPIIKPLGNWVGLSIFDSAQFLAKKSGGEAVRVGRPADYARGLNKIIGNLTGRYSLGFTLAENEQDDGQMHPLEVRVRARDDKGKERKLEVVSRQGFYLPNDKETAQK